MRAILLLCAFLLACGPSAAAKRGQSLIAAGDYGGAEELAAAELAKNPRDGDLWNVRIRAALGRHDARAAVAHYAEWRRVRGADDAGTLRMMAMTTVWQGLESPSAPTRIEAIRTVERLEIERLADAVADHMGDDDDAVAAAAAVAILRAFPQAPEVASQMLRSDDASARAIAVEGIGRKVGARAADDLRALAADPDPGVRRAVIRALGALGDAVDTERLTALAGDADAEVRAAALTALAKGKRGDLSALAREALVDEHLGVRIAAVALLDASGDEAGVAALLTGEDRAVAVHAARAVAKTRRDAAAAALDRALGDPEWSVRAGALNIASQIVGRDGARTRAAAALDDDSLDVRLAAARVLGDDPRARAVFTAALDSPDLRLWAAIDLARLGDAAGLAALEELAVEGEGAARRAAVSGHLQARRTSPGLVAALASDDPVVRVIAAGAILTIVPAE